MTCKQTESMFSRYLDDRLSSGERGRLEQHLAGCAGCRRKLGAWQAAASALRDGIAATASGDVVQIDFSRIAMVEETGADLSGSRLVLGDIRDQVAAINSLAERATANLSDSLAELTEASSLNGRIVEAFEQTAVKVEAIATAAADQARAVSEVSAALTDLDHGASEIDAASATLLTGVDRMACAHGELESVLSESGDAAPEARPLVASSA